MCQTVTLAFVCTLHYPPHPLTPPISYQRLIKCTKVHLDKGVAGLRPLFFPNSTLMTLHTLFDLFLDPPLPPLPVCMQNTTFGGFA